MDSGLTINRRQLFGVGASLIAFLGLMGCSVDLGLDDDATGIIGAMESEVTSITDAMENVNVTSVSGMEFAEGTIGGNKVVVVQCGIGKVNAGICAQTLIVDFGVKRVINTGVAGSLTDELGINDFVVSVDAVQHDYDLTPLGYEPGEFSDLGVSTFTADENLRELAVAAIKQAAPDSKVLEGRVCTGDQFIATDEQVEEITSNFGGLCCEMEGGAIAQVCYRNGIPFVIIRAISDDSDDDAYEAFQENAAEECANAVITMVSGF